MTKKDEHSERHPDKPSLFSDPNGNLDPSHNWLKALPNQLTLFRIGVVPIVLLLFPLGFEALRFFCALLYFAACVTDFFDGFIARQFKVESKLGALLDPIADKMLTAAGLIVLAHAGTVWAWLAGILLCREIGISGLRLIALEEGLHIEVNIYGKWKTFLLDVAIVCLMVNYPLYNLPFREVGMLAIWATLFLSMYSAWVYIDEFWRKINL